MSSEHAQPGRPRDPQLENRVKAAAIEVFGASGWAGFTLDAVARRAGVGKGSLYLRWADKEELLLDALDALDARIGILTATDTGEARSDLVELVLQFLRLYAGPHGPAALRLGTELRGVKGIEAHFDAMRTSQVNAARAIVRRGVARGQLPKKTPVTLLLDTLCGGAMIHAMVSPEVIDAGSPAARRYADQLVDFVLGAVVPPGEVRS
ncbi:TetR/AcrR family transcriptional regulator [Sporichthya sp.]|uniref:TetR/AcrR family transcriptional regulator n=1 Tax=Sporichthya sp. TaxID=65475 RepID=UPI0025D0A7BD|nr:TetR/AcrR family transcriptional regulator [Sporichthya sp.]